MTETAGLNAGHAEALARQAGEHAETLTRQAEALARMADENASLEENVANLQARNNSIKFHLRSLYELGKERVARRFDRHGSGPQ